MSEKAPHPIRPAESEDVYYVCQRCGNCCRWPGEVPVSDQEIRDIALFLGIPETIFIEQYTQLRLNRAGLTLIDQPDGACIFLEDNACTINPVKPDQCRGFPNRWNFAGWRDLCEAIPVPKSQAPAEKASNS
ncbi:MAG: YkgJ family cysteine cluster protein [Verrucomicrobiae bacterium]|nr:YkgJ family cysteine cluster protein [Verrucomicrobiae bacterium]